MGKKITPKSVIVGMIQAADNRAMPVKIIVSAGKIFGFTENTVRVAITRMLREGSIESDERSLYRLSGSKKTFSRYIGSWKRGEQRLRTWEGCWICSLTNKGVVRRSADTKRLFEIAGFKEGLPGLQVRPDNLSISIKTLESLLAQFGNTENEEIFIVKEFSEKLTEQWIRYLWPVDKIIEAQQVFLHKIEQSAERIEKLPIENALVESFLIGSEAVRLLITDPLLPAEIMDNTSRVAVTRAMMAYDDIGKRIWLKKFDDIQIDKIPSHLQLVKNIT